mgnify:CR=1 FL=1
MHGTDRKFPELWLRHGGYGSMVGWWGFVEHEAQASSVGYHQRIMMFETTCSLALTKIRQHVRGYDRTIGSLYTGLVKTLPSPLPATCHLPALLHMMKLAFSFLVEVLLIYTK